ncbi:recombinase family protein [Streptomyces sp. NBC_01381]|uniref:recombinase family protein n=1 Tax=Streptomyces sp. NBC_01381 TaxID=2903845 RepID=UPI00225A09F5|nr:recombinase family protein [Streptomyces sp. NBC_01381]MCX4665276.1 recombinase family protein [Streptomyces sp. NBC_01381]
MAKPKRVGIYVRISKDRKGQELGIQRQEKACRELCERMGWGVYKVYPENDISASTTSKKRRPQYAEMMRDARDGFIDGVVVYSIDRLTRRISELSRFLEEQKEQGFAFATTEGEDTQTANGRMILTIKGAVAQQETERMSERVNNSLLQRREQGKPHAGGKRQFGFKEGTYFKELDDDETELIRAGYRMLMDRTPKTPGDVARFWNAEGSRTPLAAVWDIKAVKRVFRAERTGGIVTHKGRDVGDSIYGAPLTREQWENVQAVLDGRATRNAQGQGKRKHVYSGFLRCGHCQSTMRVQWATVQGRTFRRTFCHSAERGANGNLGCGKVNRQYTWIEERLNEVVEAALSKRKPQQPPAPDEDLTGQISLLEDRIRAMRGRWKAGQMEDEDYFDSLAHLRDELQTLRTREAATVVRQSRAETDVWAVWQDDSVENLVRRRAIVSSVIHKVDVFSVGRGRRKPPEISSIKITPVGAEDQTPSD